MPSPGAAMSMISREDTDTRGIRLARRKASWFLLLTIPVAVVGSALLLGFTSFSWCGISGCSGGGFGRIPEPSLAGALVFSGLAGLLWFAALAAVPWLTPRWARCALAAILG